MSRITYKNAKDVAKIREAGFVVSTVLATLRDAVAPGVSTLDLDNLAYEVIKKHGGTPSFLNHRAGDEVYHHSTCISINEEVVHGIPRAERKIKEGDLVSIDVGVKLKGFHADSALTVGAGAISEEKQRLLDVTRESLFVGLRAIRCKGHVQDIGRAVQEYVEAQGFSVVRELSGHGIGRQLWEPPSIYNFVDPQAENPPLLEGMTIAIEPMVNAGKPDIGSLADGWTVVAVDLRPSAHFEHTVVITRDGCEILTLGPHDPGPWPR
jgi:methionyl aminopeptidase